MTSKKVPSLEQVTGPSFEEAMTRLEKIVEELESGKLPLEESLTRFEEGVKLSSQLHRTLEEAEKRIERLVENANGPGTVPDNGAFSESPEKSEGELPF